MDPVTPSHRGVYLRMEMRYPWIAANLVTVLENMRCQWKVEYGGAGFTCAKNPPPFPESMVEVRSKINHHLEMIIGEGVTVDGFIYILVSCFNLRVETGRLGQWLTSWSEPIK